jgi:hypothetical protein
MEKVDPDPGPDFDFEKEKPQQGGGINRMSVPYKPRKPILGHKQDYDHESTTSSELPCAISDRPITFFWAFFWACPAHENEIRLPVISYAACRTGFVRNQGPLTDWGKKRCTFRQRIRS